MSNLGAYEYCKESFEPDERVIIPSDAKGITVEDNGGTITVQYLKPILEP